MTEIENQLEEGALSDRSGRNLDLNDRGRFFLPLNREIVDKLEDLDNLMNEKGGQFAGTLQRVTNSTIGNYVLPYLITAFISMHPNVHVNMLVCNTGTAKKLIMDRHVDLGFVEAEVRNELIKATLWLKDELVFITRITDEVKEEYDVATELKNYNWVMREPGSGTAQIFKKSWVNM